MQELHTFSNQELMALLLDKTIIMTRLFTENEFGEDYEKNKLFLKAIQSEIKLRKGMETINVNIPPEFTT